MLPIFASFIVLCGLIAYETKKDSKRKKNADTEFFERERLANSVRKQPLDDLIYIKPPVDSLPLNLLEMNSRAVEYQKTIFSLADSPIANFTGISNTDLKLTYGVGNLSYLTECDQNYTSLVRSLYRLASLYAENNLQDEAVLLLEYAVSIGTDVSGNYTLLARIYSERDDNSKMEKLFESANTLPEFRRKTIVRILKESYPTLG